MDEYIRREDVIAWFMPYAHAGESIDADVVISDIKGMKAADVVPVVHGQWKEMHYEGGILDGTNFDRCSVCGYERVFDDPAFKTVFKYCPNCGAKMDGGNSDEVD